MGEISTETTAGPIEPAPSPLPEGPELFFNRELSWLEFNQRVLDEAESSSVPLLERLKFVAITSSNLDEFFMVRVAGLVEQVEVRVRDLPPDGMTPTEQLAAIAARTQRMVADTYRVMREQLLPELADHGVRLAAPTQLDHDDRGFLQDYFLRQVLPILTPLAIDPGHPFPHVRNRSLNVIAMLSGSGKGTPTAFAVVQVPSVLPRLVRLPERADGAAVFVLLEDIIADWMGELFPGFRVRGAWAFRVTRNFDLEIDEEEAEDLLETVQDEVRRRDRGRAVCVMVDAEIAGAALDLLVQALGQDPQFVFHVDGALALHQLTQLSGPLQNRDDLKDEPFRPVVPPALVDTGDIYEIIRRGDVLLHHPYESFDPVVEFVERSAVDPDVLAIKQTLYRTSGDSPIVKALIRAAENGKQVAALVEIKARFDEENNIQWARALEESGVHVVYGLLGLKTHCKVSLVVRREGEDLRRYVHFGTGNYNPMTARLYTDLSLFTAQREMGEDASALFNLLTSCTAPTQWNKLIVAPLGLHERIIGLIEREARLARAGRQARIVAKMNSLVDPDVVEALYRASRAGVRVELVVRGICCLRPGIPGLSDNIRVVSIVDRFLEHSRIFYFEAGGTREVYASSADWMPRNFQRRVEVMFPVEAEHLKARIIDEVLQYQLDDDVKSSVLGADGVYRRVSPPSGEPGRRSQARFLALARHDAESAAARVRMERPFVVRPARNLPDRPEGPASGGGVPSVE
jgi:polyphosphate kinase